MKKQKGVVPHEEESVSPRQSFRPVIERHTSVSRFYTHNYVPVLIVTACPSVADQLLRNYTSGKNLIKIDQNEEGHGGDTPRPQEINPNSIQNESRHGMGYYKRKNKRVTEWLVEEEVDKEKVVFSIIHTGLRHAMSLRQMLYKQAIEKRSVILFVFSYTQSSSLDHITHTV
jgi:hypothetical protein